MCPIITAIVTLLTLSANSLVAQTVQVVASTTDLAEIAREIGGNHVSTTALCRADQDPHHFEILPQHVLDVRKAGLYLKVGAGLDFWLDNLLTSADNPHLQVVDCSNGIPLIHEADEGKDEHDEHELGNPHYWLGPSNVDLIAANIMRGLVAVDPINESVYQAHYYSFVNRFDSAFAKWKVDLAPCRGAGIVTYHESWNYFARDFDLTIAGTVEPHPGVEPSPIGLARLENNIRRQHTQILILEPFESQRLADLLATDTGIFILHASASVGSADSTDIVQYFDHLVHDVSAHCSATPLKHEK